MTVSTNYFCCTPILPRHTAGEVSHRRVVYQVADATRTVLSQDWVVRLDTAENRRDKFCAFFPHADEIAYKVSKLLGWPTVPKAKIVHSSGPELVGKYAKYQPILEAIKKEAKASLDPVTFTIKKFVPGCTLAGLKDLVATADCVSYQRMALLQLLLDMRDLRADNMMYQASTGQFYAIDNEYMVHPGTYAPTGVLFPLKALHAKLLDQRLLSDLLKLTCAQLEGLRDKYMKRDRDLCAQQAKEPAATGACIIPDIQDIICRKWEILLQRLLLLQKAIKDLQGTQHSAVAITIESLQEKMSALASDTYKANYAYVLYRQKNAEEDRELGEDLLCKKIAALYMQCMCWWDMRRLGIKKTQ